jgi:lipopolysaccharide transport system ATP-binding protein
MSSNRTSCAAPEASIEARELSKVYRIYGKPVDRLKQPLMIKAHALSRVMGLSFSPPQYFREFWALKNVSFEVGKGECFGILGRNGAGKSTLLQILAGTMAPTTGEAHVRGRIGALLELGSGFSGEFTGRENLWLSAALMGLSRQETEAKLAEILEFAEIGDFIDQPVKTYSSGMVLRLAFSVHVALDPSILIVDEALAVGDARFQKRCYDRINAFRKRGGTVVFVTHDMNLTAQLCDRAMILEKGQLYALGEADRIAREYHRLLFGPPVTAAPPSTARPKPEAHTITREDTADFAKGLADAKSKEVRYGSKKAVIAEIIARDEQGTPSTVLTNGMRAAFALTVAYHEDITEKLAYGFIITNARGVEVYGTTSSQHGQFLPPGPAGASFECRLEIPLLIVPGVYFLTAAVARAAGEEGNTFLDCRFDALEFQVVGTPRSFTTSVVDLRGQVSHQALVSSGS